MVATEEEDMEEAAEAMAEEVVAATVAAGVEAAVAVVTEGRAGKRSVTHVCILLYGFSEASRRWKLLWAHLSVVINLLQDRSAFDSSPDIPHQ